MKIRISGPVSVFDDSDNIIEDIKILKLFRKMELSEELCSDYIDGDLEKIGITGGSLKLSLNQNAKKLLVVTEYSSPGLLTELELTELVEFTIGQWSDGIGENGLSITYQNQSLFISYYPIPYPADLVRVEQINDSVFIKIIVFVGNIIKHIKSNNVNNRGRYERTLSYGGYY